MDSEVISHYLSDETRRAAPLPDGFTGSAGGAACGDLVRISIGLGAGRVDRVSFDAEGCATTRAAAAALAEEVEGLALLDAALISPDDVVELLGGVGSQGRHATELAADALHRALAQAAGSGQELAASGEGERVLVAMSGGVDSAVAALLERERGAEVVAVTLKLWADQRTDAAKSCCSPLAVLGARGLAHSLGIPHLTLDLEDTFRERVVGAFVAGYRAGETPNPCVLCNGDVRIDAMIALADRLGCESLVTGHYARITDDGEGPLLAAAADPAKDQSYMLSGLATSSLEHLRFPLAGLTKPEVREIATGAGLEVASKAESQDLCFLAGEGKRSFLERHGGLGERRGELVDVEGNVVGEHPGHHAFTVGQRRGLGVASPEPVYVLRTDAESNRVVVGPRERLARRTVRVREATLHRPGGRIDRVRLRYHAHALPCRVRDAGPGEHPELELELGEPAYGVAPGQTACLLDGDLVVGRATIA
ncbi:MAG TPA: tRNA 2-thiouridine(34) synthase MnmA [Solirubrobacterales bacterium]|nr:tRNA 2-thiouridine(34) synthase MnmA [Solirubrobacterales bacterium]